MLVTHRFPPPFEPQLTPSCTSPPPPSPPPNSTLKTPKIERHGFVDEYNAEFVKLSCRALDWTDDQLMGVYVGDLEPGLRDDVLRQRPNASPALSIIGVPLIAPPTATEILERLGALLPFRLLLPIPWGLLAPPLFVVSGLLKCRNVGKKNYVSIVMNRFVLDTAVKSLNFL